MDSIVEGFARFHSEVFPKQRPLYQSLARHGQEPKALFISCSDSRVVPEVITQSDPGDIFVTRNAGNVVPPLGAGGGGVTSAVEYAVVGLGVRDIVVCGHTDCGAMKALLHPELLADMLSVAAWLGHCKCAHGIFSHAHDVTVPDKEALRVLAMENVAAQLANLRTHPCVAARVATGELALHGWLFDIEQGLVLAMDGETRLFSPLTEIDALPVALPARPRTIAMHSELAPAE